jgi:drug/metabolite transporter (DMT)-like permease
MKRIDWLRLLILSLVWGGSFIFFRILAGQLPPMTTVFFRVSIGALAVLFFMRLDGAKLALPRGEWPRLALLGLINCVLPFCFYAWGETRVSAGLASIINATTPMFTIAVAGLVMRNEAMTGGRIAGVICGILGVTVVVGPDVLVGADPLGELVCLLAPFCYGWAFQIARRVQGIDPVSMAAGQLLFASLELLPFVLFVDQPWTLPAPTIEGWLALAGLGLLSTGFAYVIFFGVLASAGPTNLSLVTLLAPVTAVLLGWAMLGEAVAARALWGMGLIAVGLAVIDGRVLAWLRSRMQPKDR